MQKNIYFFLFLRMCKLSGSSSLLRVAFWISLLNRLILFILVFNYSINCSFPSLINDYSSYYMPLLSDLPDSITYSNYDSLSNTLFISFSSSSLPYTITLRLNPSLSVYSVECEFIWNLLNIKLRRSITYSFCNFI